MNKLLTLPEVAKILDLAERTIYLWSQEGKLPAFKLGSAWRYRADEIEAWLETQRRAGSPTSSRKSRKPPFREKREEEARISAMIHACEAFINSKARMSDQAPMIIEEFEDEFQEEIVREALKRLVKSKKFEIKEVLGLNDEKVKVLQKKKG